MKDPRPFREKLADTATVVVAIIAVIVAGSMGWGRLTGPPRPGGPPARDRNLPDWATVAESGHWIGPSDARVVVVEFGDYECPYCRRSEGILRALRAAYPDDFAVVFRHFPLTAHRNAYPAAVMAECGAEQGRFEEVHRLLFDAITLVDLDPGRVGVVSGVPDTTQFTTCSKQQFQHPVVEADMAEADRLGIHAVPTFIVQGTLLGTAPDSAGWFRMVEEELHGGAGRP